MKILYATDGSEAARAASDLICGIARRESTQIEVLKVVAPEILTPESTEALAKRSLAAGRLVRETAADLWAKGFDAEGTVGHGQPGPVIVAAAKSHASLVLVGAAGVSRMEAALLGSTSRRVLHESHESVLVVHEFANRPGKVKVLFGADGSVDSHRAISAAVELLDPARVSLTSLSVAQTVARVPVPAGTYGVVPAEVYKELEEESLETAGSASEAAAQRFDAAGFEVEAVVSKGVPAVDLVATASRENFDLVVVGTRGLGRFGRLLLGSVSDRVTRAAPATLVGR